MPRPRLPVVALAVIMALVPTLAPTLVPTPARAQDGANPDCPRRFAFYESATRAPSNHGNLTVSPAVETAARWLRMGNCLTFTDQLAPIARLGPDAGAMAREQGGPTIAPRHIHAGIVTSSEDEARVLAFFAAQGVRARGVGAAMLGRRIYIGPFTTLGKMTGGEMLARAAGFAYPYPARF